MAGILNNQYYLNVRIKPDHNTLAVQNGPVIGVPGKWKGIIVYFQALQNLQYAVFRSAND